MKKSTPQEREYARLYNIKNNSKIKQRKRDYYYANREKQLEYNRQFYNSIGGRYKSYKLNAKNRNLEFLFTLEEFKKFSNQPCYYCKKATNIIGIDRTDNRIGYIISNCVSCCKQCNLAKGVRTKEEFYEMCRLVTENRYTK